MPSIKSKKPIVTKSKRKQSPRKPSVKKTAAAAAGSAPKRLEVTYKGHVQGVGFRFCAEKAALEHGVTGWVRNEHNGDVMLVAEGGERSLMALLESIRNCPVGRHIRKEQIRWSPSLKEFDDFRIEYHCC